MKRSQFTKLCFLLSITGLGILYGSTEYLQPEITNIESVDSSKTGEVVKIQGNVSNFYSTPQASFFSLKDRTDEIQVVDFNANKYRSGGNLTVLGRVELRQGELQLVSTEIEQN